MEINHELTENQRLQNELLRLEIERKELENDTLRKQFHSDYPGDTERQYSGDLDGPPPTARSKPSVRFKGINSSGEFEWTAIEYGQLERLARTIGCSLVPGDVEEVVTKYGNLYIGIPNPVELWAVHKLNSGLLVELTNSGKDMEGYGS